MILTRLSVEAGALAVLWGDHVEGSRAGTAGHREEGACRHWASLLSGPEAAQTPAPAPWTQRAPVLLGLWESKWPEQ